MPNIQVVSATLGVNKSILPIAPEVLVYHNPSAGQFTVQVSGTSKANILVTNMVGQIVAQKEVKLTRWQANYTIQFVQSC